MSWDAYTDAEAAPVVDIGGRWLRACADKNWALSDSLREQLQAAGVWLDSVREDAGVVMLAICLMRESSGHRAARLRAREQPVHAA